jgi:threonine dehydratase
MTCQSINSSTPATDWIALVSGAQKNIAGLVQKTPVVRLSTGDAFDNSTRVFLKMEQLQKTGSFKLRGATNKVMSLSPAEAAAGVVTSSTGNHGLAVAAAAQFRGIPAEVFVSPQVSKMKLEWIRNYGASIQQIGQNPLDAELAARRAASESGRMYVSPYNDLHVVAGQGTVAAELFEQIARIDAIYVAVGGGGLISGIGGYVHAVSPTTEVIGCWPENSRVLYESINAGEIIDFPESSTLSESTAGGVEPGSITFELARKYIHRKLLVAEAEILAAMRWAHARQWVIEGAAGVALAAFFAEKDRQAGKTIAIILCGGNLSPHVREQLQS